MQEKKSKCDGVADSSLTEEGVAPCACSDAPEEGNAAPESGAQADRISATEKELAKLKDKHLRTLADLENFKKRAYKELLGAKMLSKIDAVLPFLKVYDHFQLAVKAVDEKRNFDVLHKGMELILSEFSRAFDETGAEKIEAPGEKFDPSRHEAVEYRHSEDIPEGWIIEQWRYGYKIGDKVIQPAIVVVSAGPMPADNSVQKEPPSASSKEDGK